MILKKLNRRVSKLERLAEKNPCTKLEVSESNHLAFTVQRQVEELSREFDLLMDYLEIKFESGKRIVPNEEEK